MNKSVIAASVALLGSTSAIAQTQQVVKPPIAQYWMSVETAAGMGGMGSGGVASMMSGMMGGPGAGGRRMLLQLASQNSSSAPQAEHDIPPGLNMGPALPLTHQVKPRPEPREDGLPQDREVKGRMLIYWGCGDEVRKGQPVVIDFSKVAAGQTPPNLVSRRINAPRPPSPGRAKGYGEWPNTLPDGSKAVPNDASLRGEHVVKANYAPEIKFSLGETHDFMQPVALSSQGNRVMWSSVPNATGYFATAYGAASQDEFVMWSSSEQQEMGGMLMTFVPPAEVARLVKEKIVMPSSATECKVPGEVVQKAGGNPFVNFIAYGPEANFVQPPRPADPKIPWEQQWVAKARFKSTGSILLGMEERSQGRSRARSPGQEPQAQQPQQQQSQPATPGVPDPVQEGVKALRGIFGR
ncbi:MAG: hypothetical protein ACM30H_11130 [Clostridia bacterium]